MPRTLDLNALRSFVAVADKGSVTHAANALHLTQSAVSMQLKRLEEGLGQPLFERTRRTMVLTTAGDQVLTYARRMLALNDEIWERMTAPAYEGTVTLGAPHDIVYPHVPEVLRRFAKAYPRVRVSLHSAYTAELKRLLAAGEVDVALTTEQTVEGGDVLEVSPLVWVGAANGGHAWRQRPLPLAFETGCIFRPWVTRLLDGSDIAWTMAVEAGSSRTVEASCSADFAVHVAVQSTLSPQLAVIDHGGSLPHLGSVKIGLYVTDGPNAALAKRLAEMVRQTWRSGAHTVPDAA